MTGFRGVFGVTSRLGVALAVVLLGLGLMLIVAAETSMPEFWIPPGFIPSVSDVTIYAATACGIIFIFLATVALLQRGVRRKSEPP